MNKDGCISSVVGAAAWIMTQVGDSAVRYPEQWQVWGRLFGTPFVSLQFIVQSNQIDWGMWLLVFIFYVLALLYFAYITVPNLIAILGDFWGGGGSSGGGSGRKKNEV